MGKRRGQVWGERRFIVSKNIKELLLKTKQPEENYKYLTKTQLVISLTSV